MDFVTGGTGFLGAHLICTLISKGREVIALKRAESDLSSFDQTSQYYRLDSSTMTLKLRWVDGNLADTDSLLESLPENADVYHCAATVDLHHSGRDADLPNHRLTANIINACLENGIRRFCHVSSIATLGKSATEKPVNEDDLWVEGSRHSGYAKEKYLSELEVHRGVAEGLNAIIVNPSVITGPGSVESSFGKIIQSVNSGLRFYPPGTTGWVDVRDVAKSMLLLMEEAETAGRYILSAENIDHRTILEMIAQNLGIDPPSKKASLQLLRMAGVAGGIWATVTHHNNPLTADLIRSMCGQKRYTSQRFQQKTGFHFQSIQESITDACAFFRHSPQKTKP